MPQNPKNQLTIPLFPLNTVLFPGGQLPLRIFEPRYLEMISSCMKTNTGFGICLIKEGKETGSAAQTHNVGTLSEISYFNTHSDGLLGITASGKQRFRIDSVHVEDNQLIYARVTLLRNEDSVPIEAKYTAMVSLLESLFKQLGQPYTRMEKHYTCASWVSARLTELLPIDLSKKQLYLEMEDANTRIDAIWNILQSMAKTKPDET